MHPGRIIYLTLLSIKPLGLSIKQSGWIITVKSDHGKANALENLLHHYIKGVGQ